MSGQITRKELAEDAVLQFGIDYAKSLEPALNKNKEFVTSILELSEANKKLRASSSGKELEANLKAANEIGEKTIVIWKEQIQLENNLISTKKKNELATESTNRALVKERILLTETNKEIKQQVRDNLGLVGALERLNRARNEAQKRLGDLLSAEQKSTKEIARAKLEFEQLDFRVKAVDAAIKNYSKNIGNYSSAFSGLNETAKQLFSTFGLVTGLALFGTVVKDIFNVIKDFDRQLIAVGKTTNISGDALKQFGKEVVDLGDKLDGVSIEGLLKSSEIAGTLGVKGTENILKFSTAIEKLKLTSDIISDEQVQSFAQFIEVSKDSFENADRLASVITQLGNNFATTEAKVLSNATEIQKGVSIYNSSAESVLGLGAATASLGNEADISSSSIQKTFGVINNAIATGKNLQQVLKIAGLTQKELSAQFNKDATGTFVKFVGGLKRMKDEGNNLQVVLKSVELDEVRTFKTIGSLATNYDLLAEAVSSAKQEYNDNIALNREVEAASQSLASIIGDIKDKWQEYFLAQNQASGGTEVLAKGLRYLRDNLQSIISNIVKYGTVLLVFLGVQKALNFFTSTYNALKIAGAAAELQFALATGIGRTAVLAEAQAIKAATVAQTELNIAMKASPWGIILALVAAAVTAYLVFNDTLDENQKLVKRIADETKNLQEVEANYNSQSEKFRNNQFKGIEDDIALRKARGENIDKLSKEEIARKKEVVEAEIKVYNDLKAIEIQRTQNQLTESSKRLQEFDKEAKELQSRINAFGSSSSVGKSLLQSQLSDIAEEKIKSKSDVESYRNKLAQLKKIATEENTKTNKILSELEQQNAVKNAEVQSEIDKKAIAAAKKRAKELYEIEKKRLDDLFKLSQFRLQVAIDLDKEILDNEEASFEDRLTALFDFIQISEAKNRDAAEYELSKLGSYNEDKKLFIRELSDFQIAEIIRTGKISENATSEQKLIFEKYQNDLTNITKKGEAERQKLIDNKVAIIQKQIDSQNQTTDTELNDKLTKENNAYAESLKQLKNDFELRERFTRAHEERIFQITQEYAKKKIEENINGIQKLLDDNSKLPVAEQISAEKRKEIENKLSKYRKDLSDLNVENNQGENDKIVASYVLKNKLIQLNEQEAQDRAIQLREEANQRTKELAENLASSLISLTNSIFDARIASIDNELQSLNDYYDAEIEAAGNNSRQKDILEKEKKKKTDQLEKDRKKELVKAAIFNRIISLAQIGYDLSKTLAAINLAAAEMDALAAYGFGAAGAGYRAFQIPIAIGTAALQSAAILTTPLPKYKTGRKGGPEEFAITGDGYVNEVITDKFGNNPIITPKIPTFTYLKEDDIVHKSVDDYKNFKRNLMINEQHKNYEMAKNYEVVVHQNSSSYDKDILLELKKNTRAVEKSRERLHIENNIDMNHQLWLMAQKNWRN